jgi:NADH-quinone oxidoreductase subunit G
MAKLTIDGREVEVQAGTTLLQAVLEQGRVVPHYCYHPGLSISGNCRMCLVEVEKAPKLVIGCATVVTEGMVVRTESEAVKKARAAMMEFFLLNHPLDCPICDQAGECKLQDYAVEHGRGTSRSIEPRLPNNKAVDIGPHVLLDQERCIQCSRCIRFCDEVTKTGELAFFRRGERTVIGVAPGRPLDNLYSGNVVDICPVGALTLKEFRFQTRVWYLQNTPSACLACARNCSVMIGTGTQRAIMTTQGQQDERIKRLVPRYNPEVNGHWMCDEGRLSYGRLYQAPRLRQARVAGEPAAWDDAVARAAEVLRSGGRGKVGLSLSPRLTCEDLFAWRALGDSLGALVSVRRIVRGEDDALLLRADKGGNAKGAEWIVGSDAVERSLTLPVQQGRVEVLVVIGDPLDPADTPGLPAPSEGASEPRVLFVGPHLAGAAERAEVALPSAAWSEEDGTVVNFQGHLQRVRRAHLPHGEGRPGWRIAADLAEAAGLAAPGWTSAAEVFAAASAAVPELAGLSHAGVGMLGVRAGGGTVTAGTRA